MRRGNNDFPITIYYAFKQSEVAKEGLTSPGWATFLQRRGGLLAISCDGDVASQDRTDGSYHRHMAPTPSSSSIVLVCRKRPENAPAIIRREFVSRLRSALPDGLAKIRAGGITPGRHGAGIDRGRAWASLRQHRRCWSRTTRRWTVRTAIALINQVRDELSPEKRRRASTPIPASVSTWFEAFGMNTGESGRRDHHGAGLRDIGIDDLEQAGVFGARGGLARLLRRDELPADWDPETDKHPDRLGMRTASGAGAGFAGRRAVGRRGEALREDAA